MARMFERRIYKGKPQAGYNVIAAMTVVESCIRAFSYGFSVAGEGTPMSQP